VIKVNLLYPAQRVAKTSRVGRRPPKAASACALILVIAGGTIGWRVREHGLGIARLEQEIAGARQETARLEPLIVKVRQLEQRHSELQQRVVLIEQLKRQRNGPVQLLDQISRALPPTLWLTELRHTPSKNEVVIDGRSETLTGLSEFIAGLEASGYFKRSVEIVSGTSETMAMPQREQIKFQIRAVFQPQGAEG
jgi:type IV pilus assembly protein PilN